MASILDGIQRKFLLDVVAGSSVTTAGEGPLSVPPSADKYPYAELIWTEAEYQEVDIGSQKQRARTLTIAVYGSTREMVDLAIEELQDLWDTQPYRSAFNTLQGVRVIPVTDSPSFQDTTSSTHIGTLTFQVEYRTTIA